MNKNLHDVAWNLLKEKGLTTGEMAMVRMNFADIHKDKYPFIVAKYEKGEIKYYYSDIDDIKNLMFKTENEVVLANAIYENVKNNFNQNEFIQMLKFTFRILKIESDWA